ncbi:signal transduction histidine kinase [Legionella santicrucis]|uniref:histidine kinase n=1 Tax=Legionella santicrucis TaxID=45074 RepID=A0A0W0YTY6_9GAMM|nr:ATP-binding protein [Legionella santicrucis]KTD60341.1 signal transduction histidine kinase [Legionella santicrucis]
MDLDKKKLWLMFKQNVITVFFYTIMGVISNIWAIPAMVSPLWLQAGFALAMVLWCGNHVFWGIALSSAILFIEQGDLIFWQNLTAYSIVGIGAGLQATWAAKFIQYYTHTKTPFYTVRDILIFIFGGDFLLSLTSCTIGTIALVLFGLINPESMIKNWFIWWISDSMGILVVTPLIMTWYHNKFPFNWRLFLEFSLLIILLGCTISILDKLSHPRLAFTLLPFCILAAVRFNTRIAIIVAFLTSLSGIWLDIYVYQFGVIDLSTRILLLQSFVAIIFFTTLILSAVITEHRKAQQELQEVNIELESRVKQRTQDLNEKNHPLNNTLESLKQTQTQLIQAEKMSSLGILTAGIAHEINNLINFISANIGPLKNDIEDIIQLLNKYREITSEIPLKEKLLEISKYCERIDLSFTLQETHDLLHSIEEGARRTANIVKDLRTFSRLDESELKWVNIHENIDSTLTLLRNLVRDRIAIHKNYGNIPEIECFPGKMNQVFMNLITNAAQAISDHGEITISTHKDNDQIRISVRDTGTGMNKETMARIFEPFFTTKPTGKGTGLGLSISYSIVQDHHGSISVNSTPGKGSEFIIVLPIKYVA